MKEIWEDHTILKERKNRPGYQRISTAKIYHACMWKYPLWILLKLSALQSNFTLIDSQLPNSQVITELFMHSMDVFILCLSAFAGEMKDFAALIFRGFMHWTKTDSQTRQSFCRHCIKSKKFTNRADTESDGGKDGLKQAKVVKDH